MAVILSTGFKYPQAVISNGLTTGVQWTNPDNILVVDNNTADSNPSQASDMIVGNFNFNIPVNSVIVGIELKLIGYNGGVTSPLTTLTLYAVDNTSGSNLYYPYVTPFTGFTTSMGTFVLGTSNYLFATSWDVNQINNFKLQLIGSNGSLFMDSVLVNVYYYDNTAPTPPPVIGSNCEDCNSPIQAQPFILALPVQVNDTKIYLKTFNFPNGIPIQMSDVGSCGGSIDIVMDQGKPKGNGQPYEENAKVINVTHLPNGTVELDFGTINNRALAYKTPYGHDATLLSEHNANSEVVISNNGPFYNRFLRTCQIDVLVSPPITVQDEGVDLTNTLHTLNFQGTGVVATVDGSDPDKINVFIAGSGTQPPSVANTSSSSSGNVQVPSLTWSHVSSGTDRLLLVEVSTEEAAVITGITYNGIALTLGVANSDAGSNLRSEIWYLISPPVGTYNIIVSLSPNAYISAGAETVVNVDTSSPIGNTQTASGSDNTPTQTLVTGFTNSLVFDSLATALTPILYVVGPGQSENWSITANGNTRQGASSVEQAGTTPDNVVMDWTMTQSTDWVVSSIEIKGIPGGTAGGGHVIQDNGVPLPQEPALNFKDYFNLTDDPGVATDVEIDVVGLANDATFISTLTSNVNFQNAVNAFISGSGTIQIDQTPLGTGSAYGLLAGTVDGMNTTFTVSLGLYTSGKLEVYRNGLMQLQGSSDEWVETTPGSGIFDFNVAPLVGDIITVVYNGTTTAPQTAIQFENEGVNLGTPGTVDEMDFTGAGVTASRIGNKVTVNVTSGGGSGFSGGLNLLPIGRHNANGGSTQERGTNFRNNVFTDAGTNRLYAEFEFDNPSNGTFSNFLRVFKNDFGTYYVETEIVLTRSMLTDTSGANVDNTRVIWTTDNTYIYAIAEYTRTTGTDYRRTDVIRFDLDGLNPVATNIFAVSGTTTGDRTEWQLRDAGAHWKAATCHDGSFFITWAFWNGAAYVDQFREYSIVGTVYTLVNTYTSSGVSDTTELSDAFNVSYDPTDDVYIFGGAQSGSGSSQNVSKWTKWEISGSNFNFVDSINYNETAYGIIAPGDVRTTNNFASIVDQSTYNELYVVQSNQSQDSGGDATASFWLMIYNFPKF